jgi:hypothetical protein
VVRCDGGPGGCDMGRSLPRGGLRVGMVWVDGGVVMGRGRVWSRRSIAIALLGGRVWWRRWITIVLLLL